MALKLGHKALAKTHHFIVGFSFGIKVGTAFTAAHGQTGQGVFEALLKSQEFDNRGVDGRVKTQAAFVRADCRIKLYAEAAINLNFAAVIHPWNTELYKALRLHDSVDHTFFDQVGALFYDRLKGFQNFLNCLDKLGLIAIAFLNGFHHAGKICIFKCHE